jgi:hypothetical protein
MRRALHQGSLTCRRFYRQVVKYACGTRPSPVDSRSARMAIGAANSWTSNSCWNHRWQKVRSPRRPCRPAHCDGRPAAVRGKMCLTLGNGCRGFGPVRPGLAPPARGRVAEEMPACSTSRERGTSKFQLDPETGRVRSRICPFTGTFGSRHSKRQVQPPRHLRTVTRELRPPDRRD